MKDCRYIFTMGVVNIYLRYLLSLMLWSSGFGIVRANEPGLLHEICMSRTFHASCPQGQVIVVRRADFGRMRVGRCVTSDRGHIGCISDATPYLDTICSGKQECSVQGIDSGLFELNTCPEDYPPYLEVVYDCVDIVFDPKYQKACSSRGVVTISDKDEGVLSRDVAFRRSPQGPVCPIIIETNPGQMINLTIVDFGTNQIATGSSSWSSCYKYAAVTESSSNQPAMICRSRQRERHALMSQSHMIQIKYAEYPEQPDQPSFLLRFSVVGCPDIDLNGNTLLDKSVESMILFCESSRERKTVKCVGNEWEEEITPCKKRSSWNSGIIIVLMIGIAIGTIVGSCLFLCILYCVRKRRQESKRQNQNGYYSTMGGKQVMYESNYQHQQMPGTLYKKDRQDTLPGQQDFIMLDNGQRRRPNHQYEPVYETTKHNV